MKTIFSLIILLNLNLAIGQTQKENQFTIHIESGKGENIKACEGYFFGTELTKDKILYSALLADKTVIKNTGEIELFFNPKNGEKPNRENSLVIAVPLKSNEIIYDKNSQWVIIPLYFITKSLENKRLVYDQILLTDANLLEFNPNLTESEFNKLKSLWDWEVTEATKRKL